MQERIVRQGKPTIEVAAAAHNIIIGNSSAIQEVISMAKRVAKFASTIVLIGESGTGKELIAELIHKKSSRSDKELMTVNCGAFQDTLLESEFFGYVKGAFTGAHREKQGIFERANGGTIFLDEVSEMSSDMQVKLLRVVEYGIFQKVGSSNPIKIDVRIIVASSRTLERAVREGTFREDLYYRLNVISIYLPPLRERKEDIPLLASHFLKKYSRRNIQEGLKFSPEVLDHLGNYNWPGNVRELENAIERAVVMNNGSRKILPEDFDLKGPLSGPLSVDDGQKKSDKVSEPSALSQVLCVLESVINGQRQAMLDMANDGTNKKILSLRTKISDLEEELSVLAAKKRRGKRPTDEKLLEMTEKQTYEEVAVKLGVHITTVGGWIRQIKNK